MCFADSNKDNFDKMLKKGQEAMAREMPSTIWGAMQAMVMPPPPPGQASQQGTPKSTEVPSMTSPSAAK